MGDYVSVDPARLKQLATALQDAARLLPDKKSAILTGITGWDGSWDASAANSLAAWLDGQWRPMLDRADFAATMEHQPVMTSRGDLHAAWRGMPWNLTDADEANEGAMDARNIRNDLSSGDPAAVARARQELADAMDAHSDDPAWMEAFVNTGGMGVVDRANKVVLGRHIPVDALAQKQLGAYAGGVAAASTMVQNGRITVPTDAFGPLLVGDSVMATGAMMKFGPAGTAYGARFLADAGDAALSWRQQNPPRPGYSEGGLTSGGYIPSGYVQDDDAWWNQYGVNVSYISAGADEQASGIQTIRDYDPSTTILNVVGDNEKASQLLLTGDKGRQHADALIRYDWATPPGLDDSGPASKVLRSATLDRTPPADEASAQAAANVFAAAYDLDRHDPRNDYTIGLYPKLPATLSQTMAQVGSAYLLDLAKSTGDPAANVNTAYYDDKQGRWVVQTNTAVMNSYLKIFMTDPTAAGAFQGAVNAQLQASAEATAKWPDATGDLLRQTGYLNGMTAIVLSDHGFEAAQAKDAANARAAAYTNATLGLVRALPIAGDAIKFTLGAGSAILTATGSTLFPTDAAAGITSDTQYLDNQKIADMRTYVAQGYANAGVYSPPAGASFVHDGQISPRTPEEQAAFDNWYANMPNGLADLNDSSAGFGDAVAVYAPDDDKFSPTN